MDDQAHISMQRAHLTGLDMVDDTKLTVPMYA